jgi:hypothetical protein
MKNKRMLICLLPLFAAFIHLGAEVMDDKTEKSLFCPDGLEKQFTLHLTAPALDFTFAAGAAPVTAAGETGANAWKLLPAPASGAKKKVGKALLILSGFILAETIRYWVESRKWREDWNYRFIWDDQKVRFFSLKANRFDSNPFVTNWTHLVSGHLYYSMGRSYNLDPLASLLVSIGSSLWWEYVTEWREVISINDNLFSGLGGISLAEPLFQIGSHFNRRPGLLNKAIGFLFNPVVTFNDVIAGKKKKAGAGETRPARPRMQLQVGPQRRSGPAGVPDASPLLHFGLDAEYLTIPGHGDPEKADVGAWSKTTLLSEISLDLIAGAGRVQEFSFFSRAVLAGFFRQKLRQGPGAPLRGFNYFVGLATSFDLFKKAASAYYDKGEYHYDFAAGERAPLPTGFVDKFAAVNLIGPALDARFYAGPARFRFSLSASADFALVNALALNLYSRDHDIYEPRLKTTLVHYGYYYAWGATLTAAAGVQLGNIGFSGRCKYQSYGSIEGLDRFQDQVADDVHITDSRLAYELDLRYCLARVPVALALAFEGIRRRGSIHEVACRETEQRFTTQLIFSF